MTENENWAKAENPEVEKAKDEFAEAVEAQVLRTKLTQHATGFANHGGDRDWTNTQLARLGADQIHGRSEYRMNAPITGDFGWRCTATSRAEALERFKEQIARVAEAGKITADGSYDNVYGVKFIGEPQFHSGPEDPGTDDAEDFTLDELKAAVRLMFKQGVSAHGWSLRRANQSLSAMGVDALPEATVKTVKVPVSGVVEIGVHVFEGDDDAVVQAAAAGVVARQGSVYFKPEEVGTVSLVGAEPADDDGVKDAPY